MAATTSRYGAASSLMAAMMFLASPSPNRSATLATPTPPTVINVWLSPRRLSLSHERFCATAPASCATAGLQMARSRMPERRIAMLQRSHSRGPRTGFSKGPRRFGPSPVCYRGLEKGRVRQFTIEPVFWVQGRWSDDQARHSLGLTEPYRGTESL